MNRSRLKLIGKGLFSKVYRLNDTQVLINSICPVKECISLFVDNKHFPPLQKIDTEQYTCEYYPRVTSLKNSLDPDQYKIYQDLRKLSIGSNWEERDLYFLWREQFESLADSEIKESLIDVIGELSNYGRDIFFEISPRNVAVKEGKLILLDVFYMNSLKNKTKKYAY